MTNREITKRERWGREVANIAIGVIKGVPEESRTAYTRKLIEILEGHEYIKRNQNGPEHPETRIKPRMTDVNNTSTPEGLAGIIINLLNPNYNAATSNRQLKICLIKLMRYYKVPKD